MAKRKPQLFIPEVLEKIAAAESPQEKANICWDYETKALKLILAYAFNPTIELAIKDIPPYRPDPRPLGETVTRLEQAGTMLPNYRVDSPVKKKAEKFHAMLTALSKEEGKILEAVVNKDLKVKGVSIKFLNQVWPDMKIPDGE